MNAAHVAYVALALAVLAGVPWIVTAVARRAEARRPVTVPPPFCDPTGQPWPDDEAARLIANWRAEAPEPAGD